MLLFHSNSVILEYLLAQWYCTFFSDQILVCKISSFLFEKKTTSTLYELWFFHNVCLWLTIKSISYLKEYISKKISFRHFRQKINKWFLKYIRMDRKLNIIKAPFISRGGVWFVLLMNQKIVSGNTSCRSIRVFKILNFKLIALDGGVTGKNRLLCRA